MGRQPTKSPQNADRRRFLKTVALGTIASPFASPAMHASDKAGKRNALVGEGEFQYECLHDWGAESLPRGAHYGDASHGVAIDSTGLVYITHFGDPGSMFVFDPAGKFVKSMGDVHQTTPPNESAKAARGHGIDIRSEAGGEFLYLSPSDPAIPFTKMDLAGEIVWRKDRAEIHDQSSRYPEAKPLIPTNISFAPDGGYFLGDGYGSHMIHQYDSRDQYVRTIGGPGRKEGEFQTPHGQWLDDRDGEPKLVVADRANKRLQWFDMQGNFVKQLGGFLFPADIDTRGDLMIVPDLHARLTLLDKENRVLAQLGDDPAWRARAIKDLKMRRQRDQWLPGKFVHPHDACFDADGNLFVAEWVATGRVTKLCKRA